VRDTLGVEGWALDLGAHIGAVSVCLALDHPRLDVVAVEPVPENAEQLRRHAIDNGVALRIRVVDDAAVGPPGELVEVRYRYEDPDGEVLPYGWVANPAFIHALPPVEPHRTRLVQPFDFARYRELYGPPALVKIDVEGGEWFALHELLALEAPLVVGEWHPVAGHESADELAQAFREAGYLMTLRGRPQGPGQFRAELGARD
jgi:FkbM family methyltransferase